MIGTTEDLKNPSLTKMYEFFKTWYVANNMGLVLSGDFNTEEVLPMIEEKFGKWESGTLPEKIIYQEEEFKGREFIEGRMSPIKLGLLGFRTPSNGHEDLVALSVCNYLLSNEDETGIIDQLMLNNDIMMAMMLPINYNDYGETILLFVPKVLGQKLETAEELVMAQLQKVKDGAFDDWMVEAAKNILYRDYLYSLESNGEKAQFIANAFGMGIDVEEHLKYPEKLKAITKEDIIKIANKYYGENYLAFYSKMGSHKKDKIDKPEYEALTANTNTTSEYALKNDSIPVLKLTPRFIDFEKDVIKSKISGGEFYFTQNPVNDIFTMEIKFGIGYHEMPLLRYAGNVMNYASIDTLTTSAYKNEFSKLGCSYYVMSDNSYLTISLDGIEENLEEALILINKLITQPQLAQHKINILIENEKAERKFEDS
jgi:Zn-dependent M16 (insulinase) family peptidase